MRRRDFSLAAAAALAPWPVFAQAKFDVRKFHNAVLDNGALPLDVLEPGRRVASGAVRG